MRPLAEKKIVCVFFPEVARKLRLNHASAASGGNLMTEVFCQLLRDAPALDYFRAAVWRASEALRLRERLQTPKRLEALVSSLSLASPHRLQALLDVLVHEGWLERRGDAYQALGVQPPAFATHDVVGPWGSLAHVIRSDAPIPQFGDVSSPEGEEVFVRYQEQMMRGGRPVAEEMMRTLAWSRGARLLDVGGGFGTYSEAFLAADPRGQATLLELPHTVSAGRSRRTQPQDRLSWVEGSAFEVDLPAECFDIVMLSNVIHWYGPDDVRRLLARTFEWTAPHGVIWIKDLSVEPDGRGPSASLWFALNMALVSGEGRLYTSSFVERCMSEAGWDVSRAVRLAASPDCLVWSGAKAERSSCQARRSGTQQVI